MKLPLPSSATTLTTHRMIVLGRVNHGKVIHNVNRTIHSFKKVRVAMSHWKNTKIAVKSKHTFTTKWIKTIEKRTLLTKIPSNHKGDVLFCRRLPLTMHIPILYSGPSRSTPITTRQQRAYYHFRCPNTRLRHFCNIKMMTRQICKKRTSICIWD